MATDCVAIAIFLMSFNDDAIWWWVVAIDVILRLVFFVVVVAMATFCKNIYSTRCHGGELN